MPEIRRAWGPQDWGPGPGERLPQSPSVPMPLRAVLDAQCAEIVNVVNVLASGPNVLTSGKVLQGAVGERRVWEENPGLPRNSEGVSCGRLGPVRQCPS